MKKIAEKFLVSVLAVKGWKLKLVLFIFNLVWDKVIHSLFFRKAEYEAFHRKRGKLKKEVQKKVLSGSKLSDVVSDIKQLYPLSKKHIPRD